MDTGQALRPVSVPPPLSPTHGTITSGFLQMLFWEKIWFSPSDQRNEQRVQRGVGPVNPYWQYVGYCGVVAQLFYFVLGAHSLKNHRFFFSNNDRLYSWTRRDGVDHPRASSCFNSDVISLPFSFVDDKTRRFFLTHTLHHPNHPTTTITTAKIHLIKPAVWTKSTAIRQAGASGQNVSERLSTP